MNLIIFFTLLIYLMIFNDTNIIKKIFILYLLLILSYKLYHCFFNIIIEGADNLGKPINYDKKTYEIIKENIKLLQDDELTNGYKKKFDIINDTVNKFTLDTNDYVDNIKNNIDMIKNNNKNYIDTTDKFFINMKNNFNFIRTGTIKVGDIAGGSSILPIDYYNGAIKSATKTTRENGTTVVTLTYDDKGYVPIILFSYGDNRDHSGSNDIQPPVIEYVSNINCTIFLDENNNSGVQEATLYIALIKPDINF